MNREKSGYDARRKMFYTIVFVSFVTIYFYNLVTPKMSDDLLFDKRLYHSVGDLIRQEYWQYMNWNGRSVLQIILKIFLLLPKGVFDICNSLCYVAVTWLVYLNIEERKKYDVFLYALINLCIWILSVEFAQTVLWMSGACNYLWGMLMILSFLSIYRLYLKKENKVKNKILSGVLLFVAGLLAGWCNENTSGGAILIVIFWTTKYFWDNRKIEKVVVPGILGIVVGYCFLLMAPGNVIRGKLLAKSEVYSGVALYISRGLKIVKSIDEYLLVYIVVICMLAVHFYCSKKYVLIEFYEVFVFVISSLATAMALIVTTEPMPRAYFGANIFMMMAALQMIQKVKEEEALLNVLKKGGVVAAAIIMAFVYIEEGANLVRIRREVEIRERYILEEKGEERLTLPALRKEFASRYSWAHDVDISNDEANWNNDIYRICYGIDFVEVLPWNEWEKRRER